jgi:hypothetical protein
LGFQVLQCQAPTLPAACVAQTVRPHSPLRTPGRPQRRYTLGTLPRALGCARRPATGRAHVAGSTPRMDRARPALLSSVPRPFDTAPPRATIPQSRTLRQRKALGGVDSS